MPNINDAFPSNYLKASDLKGAQPVVALDRVEYEQVGRSRETKPILYFIGKEKGLVLNKTNANKLIELCGSPVTEDWHGHKVTLFSTHVEFQGDTVEAIRIKAARSGGPQRVAPPPPPPPPQDDFVASDITDDEIPF